MSLNIALDAMGGDAAPAIVIEGAALALRQHADLVFSLFGDEARLRPLLDRLSECDADHCIEIVHA